MAYGEKNDGKNSFLCMHHMGKLAYSSLERVKINTPRNGRSVRRDDQQCPDANIDLDWSHLIYDPIP